MPSRPFSPSPAVSKRPKVSAIRRTLWATAWCWRRWRWRARGSSIASSTSFSRASGTWSPSCTFTIGGQRAKSSAWSTVSWRPVRRWRGSSPQTTWVELIDGLICRHTTIRQQLTLLTTTWRASLAALRQVLYRCNARAGRGTSVLRPNGGNLFVWRGVDDATNLCHAQTRSRL